MSVIFAYILHFCIKVEKSKCKPLVETRIQVLHTKTVSEWDPMPQDTTNGASMFTRRDPDFRPHSPPSNVNIQPA